MPLVTPSHGKGKIFRAAKGETKNPNGRPRRVLTHVLKELEDKGYERVSATDVHEAFERLVNLQEDQLKKLSTSVNEPILVRIVAKALIDKRGFDYLEKLLDRAHGKAKQSVDHTTGGDKITAIGALIQEIEQK